MSGHTGGHSIEGATGYSTEGAREQRANAQAKTARSVLA